MPKNTSDNGMPVPPVKRSGGQVYDLLMGAIEPDLLRKNIPVLQKKYAKETPAERKNRGERYKKAFAAYKQQLAAYKQQRLAEVKQYRTALFAKLESMNFAREADELNSLQSSISSS